LGDYGDERAKGINLTASSVRRDGVVVSLLDWGNENPEASSHSRQLFHLTLQSSSPDPLTNICIVPFPPSAAIVNDADAVGASAGASGSWQLLHQFDFVREVICDPTKRCPSRGERPIHHEAIDLSVESVDLKNLSSLSEAMGAEDPMDKNRFSNKMRLLMMGPGPSTRDLSSFTLEPCREGDPHSRSRGDSKDGDHDSERKFLERLLPHLVSPRPSLTSDPL
jgi:hypothetical protein